MTFLELVRRIQDACNEPQATVALSAPAGSLDEKFSNYALRALRQAGIWTDWPWHLTDSQVTATAVSGRYTLDPSIRRLANVLYNGVPLNIQWSYDDLRASFGNTLDIAPAGVPLYGALYDNDTLFLYPPAADINLIVVRGWTVPAVPASDSDTLEGTPDFQDAVVMLGLSYASREHFGDAAAAAADNAQAMKMLRMVSVGHKKRPDRPRWRY